MIWDRHLKAWTWKSLWQNSLACQFMSIMGQQKVYEFTILPNKVSLSILLHWMAKERSELSKMVMRSSSRKREKRDQWFTVRENASMKRKMWRYQKTQQVYSIFGSSWSSNKASVKTYTLVYEKIGKSAFMFLTLRPIRIDIDILTHLHPCIWW